MSEWELNDKVKFYELLKGCFNKLTKEDAASCYAEVEAFGIATASQAARELRDAEKGEAWRPDIKRLGAIAFRISKEAEAARIRELANQQDSSNRQAIKGYWTDLTAKGVLYTDEQLAEGKERWLEANPDMQALYGRKDPRTSKTLLAFIVEEVFEAKTA